MCIRDSTRDISFQAFAEKMIIEQMEKPYYHLPQIRQKLVRWKLLGIPASHERRVMANSALPWSQCHPRVLAIYFKTVWDGWVTDDRMKILRVTSGLTCRPCLLGCGFDVDTVTNYGRCSMFWNFLHSFLHFPVGGLLLNIF